MRETRTNVLVVGAGPIGLWTALRLAEAGVDVDIVDRENRTAARSYACALHPGTLKLMHQYGLADDILSHARQVRTVGFYDGADCKARIQLSKLETDHPYVAILPQNALEDVLEARLRKAGVAVNWNHRLDQVSREPEKMLSTIERLEGTSTGYIVPHWELMVKDRAQVATDFVIGADGHNSLLRQRLKIDFQHFSGPEFFAPFEFQTDDKIDDEIKVVLDKGSTNVLWPLPGNKCRWTFQIPRGQTPIEFPEKERRAVRVSNRIVDERVRDYVQRTASKRAPWFSAGVKEVTWATQVRFEQRLARTFGDGRCWLAGDAAHQTGPVGVQSMNAGFFEGEALATILQQVLREAGSASALEDYNRTETNRWRQLLGLSGGLKGAAKTDKWVAEHAARILPCLPALGSELVKIAEQVGLEFAS